MHKRHEGFTIVELLIVIVVIAILAAITIVSYNGIRDRSKASQITSGIKQVEKAFKLWTSETGITTYPADTAICGLTSGNPSIALLITNCSGFSNYLQSSPATADAPQTWFYDMDNDTKPNPGLATQVTLGTNLCISIVSQNIATIIDESIDDGDPVSGKVRYDPSIQRIYYSLSYSPTV